jgi:hypothetical protein
MRYKFMRGMIILAGGARVLDWIAGGGLALPFVI